MLLGISETVSDLLIANRSYSLHPCQCHASLAESIPSLSGMRSRVNCRMGTVPISMGLCGARPEIQKTFLKQCCGPMNHSNESHFEGCGITSSSDRVRMDPFCFAISTDSNRSISRPTLRPFTFLTHHGNHNISTRHRYQRVKSARP